MGDGDDGAIPKFCPNDRLNDGISQNVNAEISKVSLKHPDPKETKIPCRNFIQYYDLALLQ
jgi:hypothetical protein